MSPLVPPLSKSDAQRALVLADILGVPFDDVIPPGEELPRDVVVLREGLLALRQPRARIDCRDGGAPFRFLVTQAAVQPGRYVELTGTPRLGERPHAPLLAALRGGLAGLRITEGSPWPVVVESPPAYAGEIGFRVSGVESSQFASSLFLGAARLCRQHGPVRVVVEGGLTSEGYLALTKSWLGRTGFLVEADRVSAGPARAFPPVPGDWSSLGYLLALSWVSGLPVVRVQFGTGHPDEVFAELLRGLGLELGERVAGVARCGLEVDAERCPDAIPTLSALATKLPRPSTFRNLGILRHKESDRFAGVVELLRAAGVRFEATDTTLTVHPTAIAAPFSFDARDDHRMAMSAAVLARLHGQSVRLRGADSVSKSFPGFWREAAKAGVQWEAME
ncbi:MAG: 3-phosphoshikimate 1-carboxyvinyltransferase [Myxococcota bacterium]